MQAVRGLESKYNIGLCNLKGFRCFVYSLEFWRGVICVESLVPNALFSKKSKQPWYFQENEKTNGFLGLFLQRALQVMLLGCITSKPKNQKKQKTIGLSPKKT
jgi:hypothetical protein